MKKLLTIPIALLLLFAILLPSLPASATTTQLQQTIYSSDVSNEAYKDFLLPGNAGNISVSVDTGFVLSHGWNANGTYRVRVGGGTNQTTNTLYRDIDVEHINIRTQTYNSSGVLISTTYSWDNSDNHPTVAYNQNGYTGTLTKWLFTTATGVTYQSGNNTCKETIYTGFYKGQVSKQSTVHSYTITITYDDSGTGPHTPTPSTPPTTPITSQEYIVTTGEAVYVPIRAVNVVDFTGKVFTVTYEPAKLTLADAQYYTAAGVAITVTSHNTTTGVITFTCDKSIPSGQTWTGVVVIMEFTAVASGTATVTVAVS